MDEKKNGADREEGKTVQDEAGAFREMAVIGCKNWEVCRLYGTPDVPHNESLLRSWQGERPPESGNTSCEAISVLLEKYEEHERRIKYALV